MKKSTIFLLSLTIVCSCFAQDGTIKDLKKDSEKTIRKDDKDTTIQTWKKEAFLI